MKLWPVQSTVIQDMYSVPKSEESLSAIKSALSKIGAVAPRDVEPKAWALLDSKHWAVDTVYVSSDDLWIVVHAELEPGETKISPETYTVKHVRREWLDFSNRDINTCMELPK
jgi:hypothetical protein